VRSYRVDVSETWSEAESIRTTNAAGRYALIGQKLQARMRVDDIPKLLEFTVDGSLSEAAWFDK